jgi:hypothetical protein
MPKSPVLCLNDDIERNYTEVISMVGDWFEERWPNKAVCQVLECHMLEDMSSGGLHAVCPERQETRIEVR